MRYFKFILIPSMMIVILWGCGSSSPTIEEQPVQQKKAVTKQPSLVSKSSQKSDSAVTASLTPRNGRVKKNPFTVSSDTIEARRGKKNVTSSLQINVKKNAPRQFYTVQIGAYKNAGNAVRAEEVLQKRFRNPRVVFFDDVINMTRVFVGDFKTLQEASAFRKKMIDQFPKDYKDSFVWKLRR